MTPITWGDLDYNRVCGICAERWLGPGPITGDIEFQACAGCDPANKPPKGNEPCFKTLKKIAEREGVPLRFAKEKKGYELLKTPKGYRWKKLEETA